MSDHRDHPEHRDHPSAEHDPPGEPARCPECDSPVHLRDRLHNIAARLRGAAQTLGAELTIDLPDRLGDHEGRLLALANELEQLVGTGIPRP